MSFKIIRCFPAWLKNLGLALAFSSRLPIPQAVCPDIQAAFAWLPGAGLILSLLALSPYLLGLSNCLLAIWAYLVLYIWLNRALHWDGLADVADALGSNKKGKLFRQALKDSRIGSMGAIALFLTATGYLFAGQILLEAGYWQALIWTAGLGRALALLIPLFCPLSPDAGLGKIVQDAELTSKMLFWLLLFLLAGSICFSFAASCLAMGAGLLTVLKLAGSAAKHGGFNGDFIGAAMVLSELAAQLVLALYL
ncbi:MAG: adenosylcobinamide-GDP ribazoletransferase [Desulfovibrionaceae bacterium]|nr:adenosylcobinamide-GDP ribazoletransferase [Desulfovibrionaceae bacterium]